MSDSSLSGFNDEAHAHLASSIYQSYQNLLRRGIPVCCVGVFNGVNDGGYESAVLSATWDPRVKTSAENNDVLGAIDNVVGNISGASRVAFFVSSADSTEDNPLVERVRGEALLALSPTTEDPNITLIKSYE